jgi:hypothetical protein
LRNGYVTSTNDYASLDDLVQIKEIDQGVVERVPTINNRNKNKLFGINLESMLSKYENLED